MHVKGILIAILFAGTAGAATAQSPQDRASGGGQCHVDPAIGEVQLIAAGGPGDVVISYEIINRGRAKWTSDADYGRVTLTVRNGKSGQLFTDTQSLPRTAAPGARMLAHRTGIISDAFDPEKAGTIEIVIRYASSPDQNPCNDDADPSNKTGASYTKLVRDFLSKRMYPAS